jgi:hypothetical protein
MGSPDAYKSESGLCRYPQGRFVQSRDCSLLDSAEIEKARSGIRSIVLVSCRLTRRHKRTQEWLQAGTQENTRIASAAYVNLTVAVTRHFAPNSPGMFHVCVHELDHLGASSTMKKGSFAQTQPGLQNLTNVTPVRRSVPLLR